MKLEPGKAYKDPDGDKFDCFAIVGRKAFGICTCNGRPMAMDWPVEHEEFEEWADPKRIKGWACISEAKFHHASLCCVSDVFSSPEEAIAACETPIACIEIDVLEGEGLKAVAR